MPITPAYKWQETEVAVIVEVALRNASGNQVDILSTECFLKVNSSPYLLQIDLFGEVDAKRSTAVVSEIGVTFTLQKAVNGLWGHLTAEGEKQEILAKRQRSLEASREAEGKRKEESKRLKERTNKLALEKQWALEEAKKQTLERRKAEELAKAQKDLLTWQQQTATKSANLTKGREGLPGQMGERGVAALDGSDDGEVSSDDEDSFIPANSGRAAIEEIDGSDEETEGARLHSQNGGRDSGTAERPEIVTISKKAANPGLSGLLTREADVAGSTDVADSAPSLVARSTRRLQQPASEETAEDVSDGPKDADKENEQKADESEQPAKENCSRGVVAEVAPAAALPPPRKRMVVPVQFTAKELRPNVPARESRLKEIELKKAQSTAGDEDAVDISERQPAFLKDKGDAFYRSGDYEGAIFAYTRALEKDPAAALCFSNRAACHLRLGRSDDCVSDCTRAVDLLQLRLDECEDESDGPDETGAETSGVDAFVGMNENVKSPANGVKSSAVAESAGFGDSKAGNLASGVAGSENVPVNLPDQESENGSVPEHSLKTLKHSAFAGNVSEQATEKLTANPTRSKAPSERERILTALVKALVRRAAAQCEKGALKESVADYEKALRLEPLNVGIEKDLQAVRDSVNPPTQLELKARGDGLYKQDDIGGAAEAYTRAIECEVQLEDPAVTRACISNRSACFVRLGEFHRAAEDCTRALALSGRPPSPENISTDEELQTDTSNSPACLKLLSRRGMAYGHLKKYAEATRDLAAAAKLARGLGDLGMASDLEQDIKLLENLQAGQDS